MTCDELDSGVLPAQEIMDRDAQLLADVDKRVRPLLHFYEWQAPSATYGYFVSPYKYLDQSEVDRFPLSLARRPTGGGIVFHVWDLAFSVLIPSSHSAFSENTLENYRTINQAVSAAVKEFSTSAGPLSLTPEDMISFVEASSRFCMARPTKYDVVVGNKKIAGAAQRKTKSGFLHQGTISLMMPPISLLEKLLRPAPGVAAAIANHTFPLLKSDASLYEQAEARTTLRHLLKNHLIDLFRN